MVSISWPRDPPISASQSAGITGVSHRARPHFFFFSLFSFFLRQGLTLSPGLLYGGIITVHCSLDLPGSSNPPTSFSQVARMIDIHHHAQLIFVFSVEMGFHHVSQTGSELLSSSNPPASASESPGITGMSHRAQSKSCIYFLESQKWHQIVWKGPHQISFNVQKNLMSRTCTQSWCRDHWIGQLMP